MRRAICGLLVSTALAAQTRYARLSWLEGQGEARLHPAEVEMPARLHLPLVAGSRISTAGTSRIEVELDDNSILRLAGDSRAELADYLRLSTGQRITHIALDFGVAYFSGEPDRRDATLLSLPGGQVELRRGSRLRLQSSNGVSEIAVIEGSATVVSPAISLDLREGSGLRLDAGLPDRFQLLKEFPALDSDTWSRERDRLLPLGFGARDLDGHGSWIATNELGNVWRPKASTDWAPFRQGRWLWVDGAGYTWTPEEPWGWLPAHFGRWMNQPSLGWVWVPGNRKTYHPGDVYWMRGGGLMGWGPLAPEEVWNGVEVPQLYAAAHATFASYTQGARWIDPSEPVARPRDPLLSAPFVPGPSALPLSREKLEWVRRPERDASIRLLPPTPEPPRPVETRAPEPPKHEPSRERVQSRSSPLPAPAVVSAPPTAAHEPLEAYYFAPIYTGIIILNPPERPPSKPIEGKPPKPPREPRNPDRDGQESTVPREQDNAQRSR